MFPSNAQQQAHFQRLPDPKHASGRISNKCPAKPTHRVMFQAVTQQQARIGYYFPQLPDDKHASGLISSDYPMTSMYRDVFPTNARQQPFIGSCFKRLPSNKHASGAKMPFLARSSAHFVTNRAQLVTHRGIWVIFSFINPWVSIARCIEAVMPPIAQGFVTRRLISLPTGASRYPQGYFGHFSEHYPGHVLALGIEAKVPSTCRVVMLG